MSKKIVYVGYYLIEKYVSIFNILFSYISNPTIDLAMLISVSLGESIKKIMDPLKTFLMTSPFFILILSISSYVFNSNFNLDIPTIYNQINFNEISFIFMILLGFTYLIININKKGQYRKTFTTGIIICLSAFPFLLLNNELIYAYSITILYSIGAYVTTNIEFDYAKKADQIINENTNQMNYVYVILYISVISSLILAINFINYTNINNSTVFVYGLTTLIAVTTYVYTSIFDATYENVYKHSIPDIPSRKYAFPSKLSLVYATTSILFIQQVNIISGILLYVPAIIYIYFIRYINREEESTYHTRKLYAHENRNNLRRKKKAQDGIKPSVNKLDFKADKNKENELNIQFSMEVPEDIAPADEPWEIFIETMDNVNNIIHSMKTTEEVSVEELDEFDEFYSNATKSAIINITQWKDKKDETMYISFENMSDTLIIEIKEQLYNSEYIDMDDMVTAEIQHRTQSSKTMNKELINSN